MSIEELGKILSDRYNKAEKNEQVAMIHLFGIEFYKIIKDNKISGKKIAIAADICESYGTEINKGCNLGKYVFIKDEYKIGK